MSTCAFSDPDLFQPVYYRNNKNGGQKSIRCFPSCCDAGRFHNKSGYCGAELKVKIRHPENKIVPFAHMILSDADLLSDKNEYVDVNVFLNHQTLGKPSVANKGWITGCQVPQQANQSVDMEKVFIINPKKQAWHYGWNAKSSCNQTVYHELRIYFVRPCETRENYFIICGVLRTPKFQVRSARRKRSSNIKPTSSVTMRKSFKRLKPISSGITCSSFQKMSSNVNPEYRFVSLVQTVNNLSMLHKMFASSKQVHSPSKATDEIFQSIAVHITRQEFVTQLRDFILVNQQAIIQRPSLIQAYGDFLVLVEHEIYLYLASQHIHMTKFLVNIKLEVSESALCFPFTESNSLHNMQGFLTFVSLLRQVYLHTSSVSAVKHQSTMTTVNRITKWNTNCLCDNLTGSWSYVPLQCTMFTDERLFHLGVNVMHMQILVEAMKNIDTIFNGHSLKITSKISILPKCPSEYVLDGIPHHCPVSIFGTPLTVRCMGDYIGSIHTKSLCVTKFFQAVDKDGKLLISRVHERFYSDNANECRIEFLFESLHEPIGKEEFKKMDCTGRITSVNKSNWKFVHRVYATVRRN